METPILNFLMPIITVLGSLYLWLIGLSIMFIAGGKKGRHIAVLGFIILLLTSTIVFILKIAIAEPRPFILLDNINLLDSASLYSFPSGHTAVAFAGSLLIGKKYGYIRPLILLACIIAFSRVYIGVHYPLDIIFGAIIGITSALIVLKYENLIFNNKLIRSNQIKENV